MKKLIFTLLGLAALYLIVIVIPRPRGIIDPPVVESTPAPTNFVQEGVLVFPEPSQGQGIPYLSYVSSLGAPTTTVELTLDEQSICGGNNGSLPCMAMSIQFSTAFGDKRAIVEGVESEAQIIVRRLRILDDGDAGFVPPSGRTYIPWAQAINLIEDCKVASAIQAHDLSISMRLKDGSSVLTVEPVIDEVFKVLQRTSVSCGDIIIGTE